MRSNLLLDRVRPEMRQRLQADLHTVTLRHGTTVVEPGEPIRNVYFPTGALVSLVTELESGARAEAAMVGFEGFVGLPVLWGVETTDIRAVVQLGGDAFRMSIAAFRRH